MPFDPHTNHPVELIEMRPDGLALYRDTVDDSRIVCPREAMNEYPRPSRARV